jgi:hypothetical protein
MICRGVIRRPYLPVPIAQAAPTPEMLRTPALRDDVANRQFGYIGNTTPGRTSTAGPSHRRHVALKEVSIRKKCSRAALTVSCHRSVAKA